MIRFNKKLFLTVLKVIVPLTLLVFILIEGRNFIGDIDLPLMKKHLNELNLIKVALIFLVGLAGVMTMFLYDIFFCRRMGMKIPGSRLFQYSFISNTMTNMFGFGGFAGAAVRTYFYQNYKKDRIELIKGIAELALFYLSGLSVLCWFFVFGVFDALVLNELPWLKFAIWGIALYLPILIVVLWYTKRINLSKKGERRYVFFLIVASTFEWIFVFVTIFLISNILGINLYFSQVLQLGVVGASAGLISMIPGGLGSFDFIFLIGLKEKGIIEEQALLLLLFYRLSYYIMPFIIGMFMLIRYLWKKINMKWSGVPTILLSNISHLFVSILVFVSGLILLSSASLPAYIERLTFMQDFLSIPIMNLSQQLSIGVGITLLGLARGIEYRVVRAYYLTFTLLIIGAIFTFSKSFDYEEAIFILIVAWILWLSRDHFYRENFVHTWGRMIVDFIVIFTVMGFYLLIGYAYLPKNPIKIPEKFRTFIFTEPSDLWLSGILGFLIAIAILSLAYWIKRPPKFKKLTSRGQNKRILDHLHLYGASVLSHLIFLHDKAIYWSKDGKVLFTYQTIADKAVVLGNPIGDKSSIFKAVEEFRDETDKFGYTPIYYQVTQEMLPYLHENGYDFLKLGEEGYVNLKTFSTAGHRMKNIRATKNRLEKEGYKVEVLKPPFSKELLVQMKKVSYQWLGGRKEKGYSLGFFDEAYLSMAPVAILRNTDGEVLAFTSILPVYNGNKVFSVDLMRFSSEAPKGSMDFMILHLIDWGCKKGYLRFNIGMAPLANVGMSKYSFLSEKIAAQIYKQGHMFYQFQGVRKFKEKYADSWEPKYLAYKRRTSILFTMIQLTYLISRSNKNDQ